jgi:MerR family transcriptional regulator, redox-sensitive transcriptional activator SoxR
VPEQSLAIGQIASRAGLRTSALRYYEETGLLPLPERVGGKRRYGPETVELLLLIRFCQAVGFSLAEVRELLAPSPAGQAKETWRQLVDAKLTQITALIDQAQAIKGVLEQSRNCDCITLESCSFLRSDPTDGTGAGGRLTFARVPLSGPSA